MKRILTLLLLVAFIGLFLLNIACGGSGYQGKDPKNDPAKKAGGVEVKPKPVPPPIPEGATGTEPPPEVQEGTK